MTEINILPAEAHIGPPQLLEEDFVRPALSQRGIADLNAARQPLTFSVLRPLTVEDLPGLIGPLAAQMPSRPTLTQIRYSHHQAARLIVQGLETAEVALITGFAPATIRSLRSDPAFGELLAFYAGQVEDLHVEALEQLDALGRDAIGELKQRLESNPASFSNREIMEVVDLALQPAKLARQGTGASTPPVHVSVQFIEPPSAAIIEARAGAIDAEVIQP